ncbi:MAG: hypothetical protein M1812_004593 [Candelaria pacifica]|nr:MAG: hypothetical protein M1812_004593 [Candelaria pacifica]
MPLQAQVSLSLELAKVFPIREVLASGAEQLVNLVNLVRSLKRTGSDFLVEKDLADIFGRGKIEPSLEQHFRDVVKIESFELLHAGSSISLDAKPGATIHRALRDRFYMSCMIQLSFLVWMHEETTLAAALVENMLQRYESKVPDATPDPDYDGILKTLQACSSQTSQFDWENRVSLVESRFPKSRQWFCLDHNPIRSLSPNILLGAMDYLYMVQSLPEDRLIMLESQIGLVPIVIWAHYILDLAVVVQNSPDGDVTFGRSENPQVIIKWSSTFSISRGFITPKSPRAAWVTQHEVPSPTIYLLDADMYVLLKTEPSGDESSRIEGQETHRLRGYGTTFLRRLFNKKTFVADDDPIFAETANLAVSFAIILSRSMRRKPLPDYQWAEDWGNDFPSQCYLSTERWQLSDSSRLIFWGIKINEKTISCYLDRLSGKRVEDMFLPTCIRAYLEQFTDKEHTKQLSIDRQTFFEDIKQLASWIIAFAHVVNVESCADLPLRIYPGSGSMFCAGVLGWEGLESFNVDSRIFFNLIKKMMKKEATGEEPTFIESGMFLTSHQGWSLFYGSVGDHDPGEINCELLYIKRGVPTNARTGERKYQIADAPSFELEGRGPPRFIYNNGENSYLPRCVAEISKRTELYTSRSDEFWLSIRFDVTESEVASWIINRSSGVPVAEKVRALRSEKYSLFASYSQFHEALWGVVKTIPCRHRNPRCEPLPLDLGTCLVGGLVWGGGGGGTVGGPGDAPRIAICLIKGNARARWLAVNGILTSFKEAAASTRCVLLRCNDCCVDCAVKAAAAMKGEWLVIL